MVPDILPTDEAILRRYVSDILALGDCVHACHILLPRPILLVPVREGYLARAGIYAIDTRETLVIQSSVGDRRAIRKRDFVGFARHWLAVIVGQLDFDVVLLGFVLRRIRIVGWSIGRRRPLAWSRRRNILQRHAGRRSRRAWRYRCHCPRIGVRGVSRVGRRQWRHERTRTAGKRRASAVDHHHGAGNKHAARIDGDEAASHVDRETRHPFDHYLHGLQVQILGHLAAVIPAKLLDHVAGHGQRMRAGNRNRLLAADGQVVVAADFFNMVAGQIEVAVPAGLLQLVADHHQVTVFADPLPAVVLDAHVHVFFAMDEDLLFAFVILEAEFVEAPASLAAHGFPGALRLVVRKRVGRHLVGVVDRAGDDGPVGIAFQETDDHLLADAGDADEAPLLAGPTVSDADPAGAVFITGALAVPEELHDDASVLIRPDLLAGLTHHHGGLRSVDYRLAGAAGRAERYGIGNRLETVLVLERVHLAGTVAGIAGAMLHHLQRVIHVGGVAVMVGQRELISALKTHAVACAPHRGDTDFQSEERRVGKEWR